MAAKDTYNIPRSNPDPHYRYKMPKLRAKIEGQGNGVKTILENLPAVCKDLDRPVPYLLKFFSFHCVTNSKNDGGRYVLRGKQDDKLLEALDLFIDKYVLCAKCSNPETVLTVKGETIDSRCKACGKTSKIDMTHKLSNFILKNPPVDKEKEAQKVAALAAKVKKHTPQKPIEPVEDEVDWTVDTSPTAVEQRRRELLGTNDRLTQQEGEDNDEEIKPKKTLEIQIGQSIEKILISLTNFFQMEPTKEECLTEIKRNATKLQWSETNMYKYICAALFDSKTIRQNFYKKTTILSWFVSSTKHQKIVLYCLEKQCESDHSLINQLPDLLNGFYEEGILDEDVLVNWSNGPLTGIKNPKVSTMIKEKSKPFFEWLASAEAEEEIEKEIMVL